VQLFHPLDVGQLMRSQQAAAQLRVGVLRKRGGDWKAKKKQGRGGGAGGGSAQQASHTLTHAEQARVGSLFDAVPRF
jgi:hypothetical protein